MKQKEKEIEDWKEIHSILDEMLKIQRHQIALETVITYDGWERQL